MCIAYQVAATATRPARTCCKDASRPLRKIFQNQVINL